MVEVWARHMAASRKLGNMYKWLLMGGCCAVLVVFKSRSACRMKTSLVYDRVPAERRKKANKVVAMLKLALHDRRNAYP